MLPKLAVSACLLVSLLATSGCDDTRKEQLLRGGDVVREFKAHGIFLQNNDLFDEKDAITAVYFSPSPELAEVTLVVAVCRTDEVARQIARRPGRPLPKTAAVKRRKNVVMYLAPELDPQSRREAIEALTSL